MTGESDDRTVVIAQCTKRKLTGEYAAKNLYVASRLFRAQRKYAETFGDGWRILSAKYGLVHPEQEIWDYDRHISEADTEDFQEQIDSAVENLTEPFDHAEIIAGREYADRVEPLLDDHGLPYSNPFDGLRYAARIKAMNRAVREETNASIDDYA